ncbi:unnamed protein product [Brassica oleracea]
MQTKNTFSWIREEITRSISVSLMIYIITWASISSAYPNFAQQNYENPREATGRIVCANCHLASKPVDIEVPQAVLPDTVFEAVVKSPYDMQLKQVLVNDPATNKDVHFLKYPIYVGGNRGRGQIYPDGSKSNNTVYNATAGGIISKILRKEKGGYEITIVDASNERQEVHILPESSAIMVHNYNIIGVDTRITLNIRSQLGGLIRVEKKKGLNAKYFRGISIFRTRQIRYPDIVAS